MFEPFICPIKGSINLGDARTTHSSVSDVVTLKPSFVDDDLQEHRETVELVVFETGSHIIIGLADIARTFGTLFIKMIQKAMDSIDPEHVHQRKQLSTILTGPISLYSCFPILNQRVTMNSCQGSD